MNQAKIPVLFVIPSLGAGGAERQLCELVKSMDGERFDIHVAVFYDQGYYDGGELWPELANAASVVLHPLHKRIGVLGYFSTIPRLIKLVRRLRPAVLHGYLGGNLPLFFIGMLSGIPCVWGIRRTSSDLSKIDFRTRLLMRLMALLSKFVDSIIFNSEAGLRNHRKLGFRSPRMQVIQNGIDTKRFVRDHARGVAFRRRLGIPEHAPLVGIVGRLHPVKDHPTFLRAAASICQTVPGVHFVCVGSGAATYSADLASLASSLGIGERVVWSGVCTDMVAAYSSLTALVLSSSDEGFPNVIGEAMACGVPCVATRVGDAALVVGDAGFICDVGDSSGIAASATELLNLSVPRYQDYSRAARARIVQKFSVGALASRTEAALREVLGSGSRF